jgi:hypothetical protein
MLTHGLGRQTIYNSIYGVANAVNKCPGMDFNASGASFPSHEEQREIAEGFRMKSAADFDKIVTGCWFGLRNRPNRIVAI